MFESVRIADDLEVAYAGRARWNAAAGKMNFDTPRNSAAFNDGLPRVHVLIQEVGHCCYVSKNAGDRKSMLRQGQLVVVGSAASYRMDYSSEYGLLGVTLKGPGTKAFEAQFADNDGCPGISVFSCNARMRSFLEEIRWECRQRDIDFASAVRGQLDLLNVNLKRESNANAASPKNNAIPSAVNKAREYFNENLAADVALKDVSRAVGLSPNRLLTVFGDSMQKSPMAYLRELRLARAHEMLQRGELRVKEISAAVGFSSIEVFSHAYRRQYNCSPLETTRKARGEAIKPSTAS